ncbi:MAG: hypothetical protein HYX35_02510 [Proteobacteria bacterium]|nr:hypothetical protein [Pseudomonadota bacterium]
MIYALGQWIVAEMAHAVLGMTPREAAATIAIVGTLRGIAHKAPLDHTRCPPKPIASGLASVIFFATLLPETGRH